MEELEFALKEMKSNSAPGPDGFPTLFFKEFWDQSKEILMDMLNTLHRGELDLSRLNYGIITLIPKLQGAKISSSFAQTAY